MIEKIDECKNNPQKLSTTKVCEHIPPSFSMSAISSFKYIENKRDKSKDCMKNFCEFLREHVMKINNFKTKKMKSLTNEVQKSL